MKTAKAILLVMALWGLCLGSAGATVIFSDDFARAPTILQMVGNGWTETESSQDDVNIVSRAFHGNVMQLRDSTPNAMAEQLVGFDTTGFTNIRLAYNWAHDSAEDGDMLHVEWRLATDTMWTNVESHQLTGASNNYSFEAFDLIGAEDLLAVQFRFRTQFELQTDGGDLANEQDRVFISSVSLTGTPVPEPGTAALLGLGLLGVGMVKRKRQQTS